MIIAPYKTPAFYTGVFENQGASFLANGFSNSYSKYIDQAYVISSEMDNDIEPANELTNSMIETYKGASLTIKHEIKYNPAYLPWAKFELNKDIEYDDEGNISSIAGFSNPYITLSAKAKSISSGGQILFDGIVSYKPFTLPSSIELLSPIHGIIHS